MFENLSNIENEELQRLSASRVVRVGSPPKEIHVVDRRILQSFDIADNVIVHPTVIIGELYFKNCIFMNKVRIGEYRNAGGVIFENCLFEKEVILFATANISLLGHIEFKGKTEITISNDKVFENVIVRSEILLNCNSSKLISRIRNINIDIPFQQCSINIIATSAMVQLQNVYGSDLSVRLIQGKSVSVNNSNFSNCIIGGQDESYVYFENTVLGSIDLSVNSNKNNIVEFFDCTIEKLEVGNAEFKKFNVNASKIATLLFSGLIEKDIYITISKVEVGNLTFENFFNNGILVFHGVSIYNSGKLRMISSTFGKTDFILCNFEEATFEFENSKISDVFLAETDFSQVIKGNKDLRYYRQMQLAFGQISTAFQKQGDTVRALEYQSREIEAHYRNLKYLNKGLRKFSFTKLSLGLNKLSNDFGRSWQKAAFFSVIIGIFFFYGVVICSDQYSIGFPITFNKDLLQGFFKFMNPLRFFETESLFKAGEGKPSPTLNIGSYFFDYLGRIFVAYGFYQTIQAFRKFGRK